MWTDLDVFICNMGQVNELFWNSGDGTLVHDTGTTLRVGGNPDFNAIVADIDRDGDFDIVTAGFITPNRVFRFVHCPIGGSAKSTGPEPSSWICMAGGGTVIDSWQTG